MQASAVQRPCPKTCRTVRASSGTRTARPQRAVCLRAATEDKVDVSSNGAVATTTPTAPLDFDELSGVLKLVHETDIVELELKSSKFNLTVRKREALKVEAVQMIPAPSAPAAPMYAPPPPPVPTPVAAPVPAPAAPSAPAPPPKPAAAPAPVGVEVASPMAGTFYACPAPGEPAFVKEGDMVTKGQTIGIVEAMKMMNEIEADASGTIVKILVKSGDAVSSGQPILVIKP